jgi:hypothetical protein
LQFLDQGGPSSLGFDHQRIGPPLLEEPQGLLLEVGKVASPAKRRAGSRRGSCVRARFGCIAQNSPQVTQAERLVLVLSE